MTRKTFGDRLRELRLQSAEYHSLRDFARKVGLSATYLSHIENNKVPPPSEEVIERLAAALHAEDRVKYELYSLGDKVPLEFVKAFKKNPLGLADFLRTAESAGIQSDQDWERLKKAALKLQRKVEKKA